MSKTIPADLATLVAPIVTNFVRNAKDMVTLGRIVAEARAAGFTDVQTTDAINTGVQAKFRTSVGVTISDTKVSRYGTAWVHLGESGITNPSADTYSSAVRLQEKTKAEYRVRVAEYVAALAANKRQRAYIDIQEEAVKKNGNPAVPLVAEDATGEGTGEGEGEGEGTGPATSLNDTLARFAKRLDKAIEKGIPADEVAAIAATAQGILLALAKADPQASGLAGAAAGKRTSRDRQGVRVVTTAA